MDFPEQARVDTLRDARPALEPVLADQHRRVGGEQIDLHVVEMEVPAPFRRAAVIADVMLERALPALLELAAGDEDHVGVLEARHVAPEIATVPRVFHVRDDVQDLRFGIRSRWRGRQRGNGDRYMAQSRHWSGLALHISASLLSSGSSSIILR